MFWYINSITEYIREQIMDYAERNNCNGFIIKGTTGYFYVRLTNKL